ncbi:hypothetical protein LRS10_14815 [Phenylobacterium sp. J426]|uniref:hypothetical protein n=1 Tax=Phenylobacterium sp. J426 TaxID=2898439 RepID=UPI002151EF9B|nr:hypothetical protein [Phenylobacterium sp. J426]MCR5875341.1 hypothetical protein [Phenylobacterium sp. J426]
MPERHDPAYNRDDEQKPGRPQRSAYEPEGSEGQAATPKTLTDPASGESQGGAHAPNQAEADQTDGVRRRAPPSAQDG